MDRRAFMGSVAGELFAAPLAVKAQQAGKLVRIGLLDYAASDPPAWPGGKLFASGYASWSMWKDRTSSLRLGGEMDKWADCRAGPRS
jgi:hypothetical protein